VLWLFIQVWGYLGCSGLLRNISPFLVIRLVGDLVVGSNDGGWRLIEL